MSIFLFLFTYVNQEEDKVFISWLFRTKNMVKLKQIIIKSLLYWLKKFNGKGADVTQNKNVLDGD